MMFYILTKTDAAPVYPYTLADLQSDNAQVSFPADMTNFDPTAFSCYPVQDTEPPAVDYMHNLAMGEPILVNNTWMQTWVLTPASADEIAERETIMRSGNKQRASALLTETDYTDLPNTANKILNLSEILAYREAIRVIAINPPITVESWPIKPATKWNNVAIDTAAADNGN